tara:strand:- start:2520 stop:3296 length:777 start_codon:yes stop_codon:yes gene_type:complete
MLNFDEKKLFFDKNGFIILKNLLNNKNSFTLFDQVKNEITKEYDSNYTEIKKLGGFLTGNLDLKPSKEIVKIWEILKELKISEIISELTNKSLNEYDIKYAGNVSLPNKGDQFYHTDGPKSARKILIGVPIEDLNEIDGPTELIPGSHKQRISYWKFHLKKFLKKKIKLVLNKGDIFIRESYIWHKGTKNKSKKLRIVILFILSEKSPNFINQDILSGVKFGDNMFKVSIKDKFREIISVYLPFFYFLFKLLISFIKK